MIHCSSFFIMMDWLNGLLPPSTPLSEIDFPPLIVAGIALVVAMILMLWIDMRARTTHLPRPRVLNTLLFGHTYQDDAALFKDDKIVGFINERHKTFKTNWLCTTLFPEEHNSVVESVSMEKVAQLNDDTARILLALFDPQVFKNRCAIVCMGVVVKIFPVPVFAEYDERMLRRMVCVLLSR
jgi:hypothetical protein